MTRKAALNRQRPIASIRQHAGGLYTRAIRLYGGVEDQEEIRLYLLDLRDSVAARKT